MREMFVFVLNNSNFQKTRSVKSLNSSSKSVSQPGSPKKVIPVTSAQPPKPYVVPDVPVVKPGRSQ